MRLLVCGSRTAPESLAKPLYNILSVLKPSTIIHGAARGADSIGGQVGKLLGIPIVQFPADWTTNGRAAGPIRNQQMLDDGKPDLVIALYPNTGITSGTKDMVTRAQNAGIPVWKLTYPCEPHPP